MVGGWCDKQQSSCNCSLLFKEYQASRRYYRDHKLSMNKIMPWPTGLPSVIRSDHGTENSTFNLFCVGMEETNFMIIVSDMAALSQTRCSGRFHFHVQLHVYVYR